MQIYIKKENIDQNVQNISDYLESSLVFDKPNKPHYLIYDSNGLSFIKDSKNPREILHINFLKGALGWRMKRAQHESNLKKALGKNTNKLAIFDATAGLLTDTMIFLSLGHKVVAVEQSKILFSLVNDAIFRAEKDIPELKNLKFINGNSIDIYKEKNYKCDVIFLDPMYPKLKKNLKKSGNLETIKKILKLENLDKNNDEIVSTFLESNYRKIIVKRPLKSDKTHSNINYQVKGKTTRFDIYL
tara:strand:+ start:475 stop:1206 length:732 start_codon:yes stop_codon:yes gene_type:complete